MKLYICNYFLFEDADPWWTVGLAMIGKFNIALSFAVIYVYAGELMPTVVRSQVSDIVLSSSILNICVLPGHGNIVICGRYWAPGLSLHKQFGK